MELMKGSLNTFLNAFTYPDRTCYPVASTNKQVWCRQPRLCPLSAFECGGLASRGGRRLHAARPPLRVQRLQAGRAEKTCAPVLWWLAAGSAASCCTIA